MEEFERLKWLWDRTTGTDREKVLDAIVRLKDFEVLRWAWDRTTGTSREKVLDAIVRLKDFEVLRWAWDRTTGTSREKVRNAMLTITPTTSQELKEIESEDGVKAVAYDVFISHASEDKADVARPLAEELEHQGLRVWFDEFSLKLGDSLRRSIDHGLSSCRFGVVILSKHFFAKEWPQKELDALVAKESGGEKVILPVWHNISREDVINYSLLLSDKLAVSTFKGLDVVASEIVKVCRGLP